MPFILYALLHHLPKTFLSYSGSSSKFFTRRYFCPPIYFPSTTIFSPRQQSMLPFPYILYIYVLKKILNLCIKFLKHYEMYLDVISIEDPNYRCETIAIKDANHRRKYVVSPVRIDRGLYSWNEVRTKGDGEGKRIKTASKAEWIYNYISSVLSVENNRLDALSRMADDN